MDSQEYFTTNYYLNGAQGKDATLWDGQVADGDFNLNGYFLRIKKINEAIKPISEQLSNLSLEIIKVKEQIEVATAGREAAMSGLETTRGDFFALTGAYPEKPVGVNLERPDVKKYFNEYATLQVKYQQYSRDLEQLTPIITTKQETIKNLQEYQQQLLMYKQTLNRLFFNKYSRYIQEGTWISEDYTDDEKYYADALSVLYNSCYPQVSYSINVMDLSAIEGYELFEYELGDKTFVSDSDFFGEGYREEVIVSETQENLDDASKNVIKVQNFKNQFQDLFQKITATVQQAQYNSGAYEKGAAFVEASPQKQATFVANALNNAAAYLTHGQTVETGENGITITDRVVPTNQLRLVGGAILLSAEDPATREQTWKTGLTSKGISADLITAGKINTGEIQIMSGDEPVFRWDAYGISAYDAVWEDTDSESTVSGINSKKFVRFDKHGIYGINNDPNIDGANWHPSSQDEIDEKATFALTWEGLKVTKDNATARIGDYSWTDNNGTISSAIIRVNDGTRDTFVVNNQGQVFATGIQLISAQVGSSGQTLEQLQSAASSAIPADVKGDYSWVFDKETGIKFYNGAQEDDNLVFKLTDGDMWMKGNGKFTGAIVAESGSIGPLTIYNGGNVQLIENPGSDKWNYNYKTSKTETQEARWDDKERAVYIKNGEYGETSKDEIYVALKETLQLYKGKKYRLTFEVKGNAQKSPEIYLLSSSSGTTVFKQNCAITSEYHLETYEFYLKDSAVVGKNNCTLRFDNNGKQRTTDGDAELWIKNVKLEEIGSPQGLFMYDHTGIKDDDHLLFKVGQNSAGTNELVMKGHIEATSGKIGNMTIEAVEKLPNQIGEAKAVAEEAQNTASGAMQASIPTGNYRWTFSNDDGIIMQSGDTEVFKVGNINGTSGLKIVGSGKFTGTIIAEGGEIGGFSLDKKNMSSDYLKIGLFSGSDTIFEASCPEDKRKKLYIDTYIDDAPNIDVQCTGTVDGDKSAVLEITITATGTYCFCKQNGALFTSGGANDSKKFQKSDFLEVPTMIFYQSLDGIYTKQFMGVSKDDNKFLILDRTTANKIVVRMAFRTSDGSTIDDALLNVMKDPDKGTFSGMFFSLLATNNTTEETRETITLDSGLKIEKNNSVNITLYRNYNAYEISLQDILREYHERLSALEKRV